MLYLNGLVMVANQETVANKYMELDFTQSLKCSLKAKYQKFEIQSFHLKTWV